MGSSRFFVSFGIFPVARFVAASDASAADPTARLSEEEWAAITETFYPDRPPTHAAPEAPTMTENRNLLKGSQTPPSLVGSLAFFTRSIFHSPWRFPCRRGTRVIISTSFIPVHVTFAHRVTNCTGSTDKERRLSRSTRNP